MQIHQYNNGILYKPGPELFIADWLFRCNHEIDRDQEMHLTINTIKSCIDIPDCMTAEEIGESTLEEENSVH